MKQVTWFTSLNDVDIDWEFILRRHIVPQPLNCVAMILKPEEHHHLSPFLDFVVANYDEHIQIDSVFTAYLDKLSVSDRDPLYCYGFPHIHNNDLSAMSIVIHAPQSGGVTMCEDRFFPPVVGSGLIIGGRENHGVMRVFGDVPRIAVIAQYKVNP